MPRPLPQPIEKTLFTTPRKTGKIFPYGTPIAYNSDKGCVVTRPGKGNRTDSTVSEHRPFAREASLSAERRARSGSGIPMRAEHGLDLPRAVSAGIDLRPVDQLDVFTRAHDDITWKRVTDILVSVVALILTAPLCLIVSIAIKLTSKGPVLFTHFDRY